MNGIKKLAGAYLVGGLTAFVAQFVLAGWMAVLPVGGAAAGWLQPVPLTLVSVGLIGGVLYWLGLYGRIEQLGGLGAMFGLSGFVAAIGQFTTGPRQAGASIGKSLLGGVRLVLGVL
ncbi:MAG: hypothetical protein LBK95_21560, partial [Bifidobacteriaceae bacterium]|nr:hypothetical protein [Bifidobacteriaceae bacterium]